MRRFKIKGRPRQEIDEELEKLPPARKDPVQLLMLEMLIDIRDKLERKVAVAPKRR